MGVSLTISNSISITTQKTTFRDTSKISAEGGISLNPPDTILTYEYSNDINYRFADNTDYEFAG